MPKLDIHTIERAVRGNIQDKSKATELMAALQDVLKSAERVKANQSRRSKKKLVLFVSSREEFTSDGKRVVRVAEKLEDLMAQNED